MKKGTQFGDYRVERLLGKGAMGEVYLARDEELGRDVALKLLPEALADDAHRLARMRREARSLAAVNQSNVATIYGFEEHAGRNAIVMELIDGETLAERIDRGPLPAREAFDVAIQLARALEAAHEQDIVHRDLKPGNVMITRRGEIKVLDFGLAKAVRSEPSAAESRSATATVAATQAGSVIGTAPYMSPEQIRAQDVDERTDNWAFGCVLYEMLTGRRAFDRETFADTLAAVIEVEPDWTLLPADLPDSVRHLLRRCLRKDPVRRLRDIAEARYELEDAVANDSGATRPPVDSGRLPSRRLVAGAAAAVLVVAAGLLAWTWLDRGGVSEVTDRSIAVLPFETLGEEDANAFTEGIHGDMLTRLSKVSGLSVISRTSVMQFRRPEEPLPEIARQLGVAWVLLGEVQQVGDQVQLNARLVNATQDRQVWAESYRRQLTAENLFQIQSELTGEVAAQLQARLRPEEQLAVERIPTESLDAYGQYVRGRARLEQRTEDDIRRALEYFRRAVDFDPEYALAWAGIADSLSLLQWYGFAVPPGADAHAAALAALDNDPDLAEAHASLGIYLSSSTTAPDVPGALAALQRAVELRPSYAEAHIWLAWVQLLMGAPEEGLDAARRAEELDPLSPVIYVFLAESLLANGDPDGAAEAAARARQMQQEYPLAHFMEAVALHDLGRFDDARRSLTTARALVGPEGKSPSQDQILAVFALLAARAGEAAEARGLLAEIDAAAAPFAAGLVHAALGDLDAAFEAFARVDWAASPLSPEGLLYFFPQVLDAVRADSRYPALVARLESDLGM